MDITQKVINEETWNGSLGVFTKGKQGDSKTYAKHYTGNGQ